MLADKNEISLLSDPEGDDSGVSSDSLKRASDAETHSRMIEHMYGVEERRHHHQKRMKLDEGHAKRFDISVRDSAPQRGGTMPRGYMKENSGASVPPISSADTPVNTIDLTLGKLTLRR